MSVMEDRADRERKSEKSLERGGGGGELTSTATSDELRSWLERTVLMRREKVVLHLHLRTSKGTPPIPLLLASWKEIHRLAPFVNRYFTLDASSVVGV